MSMRKKIICTSCKGRGVQMHSDHDIHNATITEKACGNCLGSGMLIEETTINHTPAPPAGPGCPEL
jgi:DnaJ-class molecular chaperone